MECLMRTGREFQEDARVVLKVMIPKMAMLEGTGILMVG